MKIIGVYFSGTGNTKWVAEQFEIELNSRKHQAKMISIENYTVDETAMLFEEADIVGFFYPIYGSDMPGEYERYLNKLSRIKMKESKRAFTITTVAIYSGDGALVVKKFCEKMNLEHTWAYNIHMPCNFDTYVPGFQVPPNHKIEKMKSKAKKKLSNIVSNMENGKKKLEGADILNITIGSFQRIANKGVIGKYDVKINKDVCIKCGKCVRLCPTKNLKLPDNGESVETCRNCTICLRCINHCPVYAIRMMNPKRNKPFKQYKGPSR